MSARRETILKELGLGPLWKLRQPVAAEPVEPPRAPTEPATVVMPDGMAVAPARAMSDAAGDAPPDWGTPPIGAEAAPANLSAPSPLAGVGWEALTEMIHACRACGLCAARKQAVPGVGDREADWLFVGEGPGAEEDARGEPFVGQAGKLLDNMLKTVGLSRSGQGEYAGRALQGAYIANVIKCRPPGNRNPEPAEIAACAPYLVRQIELLAPKMILALGRFAAQTLLAETVEGVQALPLGKLRGRVHRWRGIPVVVSYHPAYLLRSPAEKGKAWADLWLALKTWQAAQEEIAQGL